MHLIASNEYLDCEDFSLSSPEEINNDLTMEDLALSGYCGYVVFVAYDLGACITGVEYFVTGWPMSRGGPTFSGPQYCGTGNEVSLGVPFEALGGVGGIVGLGSCFWDPAARLHTFASVFFDVSGHSGWLPVQLHYSPSSYTYTTWPHNYVIGPEPGLLDDIVVEEHGCIIGSNGPAELLDLTSPDGGETYYVGGTPPIQWSYYNISELRLEYSTDGGGTWQDIESAEISTGLYF
jgi:hypothetical protein